MRLLVLSNLFPTPAEPARGAFTAELVRHMARICEVTVVVPLPWFPKSRVASFLMPDYARRFAGIPACTDWNGIPVHFGRYPLIPRLTEGLHDRAMRFGIAGLVRRLHRQQPFDAINAHWLYPDGVAATALARQLGLPVVLTALGSDVNTALSEAVKRRRILGAARDADAITVVSNELGEKLASAGVAPAKIVTIGNGVDAERFHIRQRDECRVNLGVPPGQKVIVCIARLSEEKGVAVLVRAVSTLQGRIRGVHLYVVGDGPERAPLMELARVLHCEDAVTLLGAMPHAAVPQWLGAADVVCLPSFREGHPNAVMEALASGRPVVASRVGAVPEYVKEGTGLLVPPGDPAALTVALENALTSDWNAELISATVKTRTWDVAAGEYLRVIERVTEVARSKSGRAAELASGRAGSHAPGN